jgi:outer membrane protein
LLVCAPFAARAETLTLQEALGIAYETNPQLAAQQAALRATDEDVARANAGWRPQISATGTYGYQEFKISGFGTIPTHPMTGTIALTQPIFRGGRTVAQISRAMALVRAGEAQLTATEQTVLLNAATAYMDVVRDAGALDLNRKNVDLLKKQSESTSLQFKAGALTRTDVAQSEARLAGAQTQLAAAEASYAASQATFLQVIGTPAETLEQTPAMPAAPEKTDDVLALAQKQNPALVQAKENARAADYAVNDALGALLPQVSVTGQYQYSEGSLNNGVAFGIGGNAGPTRSTTVLGQVNVPIYQGGAEHASVRQAI